jgi:hypothetical protein
MNDSRGKVRGESVKYVLPIRYCGVSGFLLGGRERRAGVCAFARKQRAYDTGEIWRQPSVVFFEYSGGKSALNCESHQPLTGRVSADGSSPSLQTVASEATGVIVVEIDFERFSDIAPTAMTAVVFALKPVRAPEYEKSRNFPSS